jgi:hypothetical protein
MKGTDYIFVKSANGTSDEKAIFFGYNSWREYWKDKTKFKFSEAGSVCPNCKKKFDSKEHKRVGGHVIIKGDLTKREYITIICSHCNNVNSEENKHFFKVHQKLIVSAPKIISINLSALAKIISAEICGQLKITDKEKFTNKIKKFLRSSLNKKS